MHKPLLYQKISLIFLCLHLSFCVSASKKGLNPRLSQLPGYLGEFSVQDQKTHLVLIGLQNSSENMVPVIWDTGSDLSFLEGEGSPAPMAFGGKRFAMPFRKGILPDDFPGLLGNDFFLKTCVYWEDSSLLVFDSSSRFCAEPEAYIGIDFKRLLVQSQGGHFYASLESETQESCKGLVDTGASLSLLPETFFSSWDSLGKKQVFLPGKKVVQAEERKAKSRLLIPIKDSSPLQYLEVRYLTGISIEEIDFPREKGNNQVCVLGLDVLRQRPLFWDFTRRQIRIQESNKNGK